MTYSSEKLFSCPVFSLQSRAYRARRESAGATKRSLWIAKTKWPSTGLPYQESLVRCAGVIEAFIPPNDLRENEVDRCEE